MTHDNDRLDTIEIKLAHLELAYGELNDVVVRQQRELAQALAAQQRLLLQLKALETQHDAAQAGGDEKPPHY